MIKRTRKSAVAEKDSFLMPSSSLLDNHFDEILETTEEFAGLVAILKTLSPTDAKRDEYEGRLVRSPHPPRPPCEARHQGVGSNRGSDAGRLKELLRPG